jgi:3-dehydroquinate synthase
LKKIPVLLGDRSYDIVIGYEIMGELGEAVRRVGLGTKQMIVTSKSVEPLYAKTVHNSLASSGFDVSTRTVSDGEEAKSLETLTTLYDSLLENNFDRHSGIVAVGGGVVGDLAGFAAATFMRGISLVQAPTTLLAQVDSSIGGKTGVNHPKAKNIIGAFYQPAIVWTDISTLQTLPEREFRSGLAEVIKYAIIADRDLFSMLMKNVTSISNSSREALIDIVSWCCSIKARIVQEDEKERKNRSILNYGHTVGHALEALTGYSNYTHGEAIAIGMTAAARISREIGATDQDTIELQENILRSARMPTKIDSCINPQAIVEQLKADKKRLAGKTRWVLPRTVGDVFLTSEVSSDTVLRVLKDMASSEESES